MPYFCPCYNALMLRRIGTGGGAALLLLVALAMPGAAGAQGQNVLPDRIVPCDGTSVNGGTECTICHLATLAQNILNAGVYIAVFLSAFLFAWAGWKYMTSRGGGEVSKAKDVFVNVAVGLVIILGGWLVIDTLMRTVVGSDSKFGPWNKICEVFDRALPLA